jgi:cytochrome c oxidase subunit 1
VTTYLERTATVEPEPIVRVRKPGSLVVRWITSTDHKVIGYLYLATSFAFFLVGGVMALIIRAQLFQPQSGLVTDGFYNQLFTMHGTIMLLLFATPLFIGFGNVVMPLQIGAPDVAFPRLNMFSYYLFLFGGLIAFSGFITPGGAADFGWTVYGPLNNSIYTPQVGGDLWVLGLGLAGFGTILGGVNFVTTIICMRAPGMTMFRMPIFTWNILVTSILVLMVFPLLAAILFALFADRNFGSHIFDPSSTPRSTSSRCPSSASSPKSCPCSAASRSSGTRAWSARRSRSRRCRWPSGRITCS